MSATVAETVEVGSTNSCMTAKQAIAAAPIAPSNNQFRLFAGEGSSAWPAPPGVAVEAVRSKGEPHLEQLARPASFRAPQ
jgi:hypothetical protein